MCYQKLLKQGLLKPYRHQKQMPRNIVSLFKRFGRRVFQIRTSSSCIPLKGMPNLKKLNTFLL